MCTTNLPVPFFSLTKQTRWWSRTKRSINQLNSCWPKRKRTQEKMVAETRKNNGWPVMRNKTKIFWYLGLKCVIKSRRNSRKEERRTYVLGEQIAYVACIKSIQVQGVGHAIMHVYVMSSDAFKCMDLDMHHACTWRAAKLLRDRGIAGSSARPKEVGPIHMGCSVYAKGPREQRSAQATHNNLCNSPTLGLLLSCAASACFINSHLCTWMEFYLRFEGTSWWKRWDYIEDDFNSSRGGWWGHLYDRYNQYSCNHISGTFVTRNHS
jgi:hypothetical protein